MQAKLNRQDPLAKGLVFGAAGGCPYELVTGTRGTIIGNATFSGAGTKWGPSFESFTTAGTDGIWWPLLGGIAQSITTKSTVVVACEIDNLVSFSKLVCVDYRHDTTWSAPFVAFSFDGGSLGLPSVSMGRAVGGLSLIHI